MVRIDTTKTETVRERTGRAAADGNKPKRLRQTANTVSWPVRTLGKAVKAVLNILAIPFRTPPGRFLGKVLGTIFFASYFKSSWQELRQVEWPGRKETSKLTLAVFMFAVVFAVVVASADYGLDKIFRKVLIK